MAAEYRDRKMVASESARKLTELSRSHTKRNTSTTVRWIIRNVCMRNNNEEGNNRDQEERKIVSEENPRTWENNDSDVKKKASTLWTHEKDEQWEASGKNPLLLENKMTQVPWIREISNWSEWKRKKLTTKIGFKKDWEGKWFHNRQLLKPKKVFSIEESAKRSQRMKEYWFKKNGEVV